MPRTIQLGSDCPLCGGKSGTLGASDRYCQPCYRKRETYRDMARADHPEWSSSCPGEVADPHIGAACDKRGIPHPAGYRDGKWPVAPYLMPGYAR